MGEKAAEEARLEAEREAAEEKAAEEARLEAERKAAEEKAAEEARLEVERKAAEEKAAEEARLDAERKAAEEKAAAESSSGGGIQSADLGVGSRVRIISSGATGVVAIHDPSDPDLTFKITYSDGTSDWHSQTDV